MLCFNSKSQTKTKFWRVVFKNPADSVWFDLSTSTINNNKTIRKIVKNSKKVFNQVDFTWSEPLEINNIGISRVTIPTILYPFGLIQKFARNRTMSNDFTTQNRPKRSQKPSQIPLHGQNQHLPAHAVLLRLKSVPSPKEKSTLLSALGTQLSRFRHR